MHEESGEKQVRAFDVLLSFIIRLLNYDMSAAVERNHLLIQGLQLFGVRRVFR